MKKVINLHKGKRFYTAPQPDQLPGSAVTKIIPKPKDAKESYEVVQDGVVPNWQDYDFRGQNDIAPPKFDIKNNDKV